MAFLRWLNRYKVPVSIVLFIPFVLWSLTPLFFRLTIDCFAWPTGTPGEAFSALTATDLMEKQLLGVDGEGLYFADLREEEEGQICRMDLMTGEGQVLGRLPAGSRLAGNAGRWEDTLYLPLQTGETPVALWAVDSDAGEAAQVWQSEEELTGDLTLLAEEEGLLLYGRQEEGYWARFYDPHSVAAAPVEETAEFSLFGFGEDTLPALLPLLAEDVAQVVEMTELEQAIYLRTAEGEGLLVGLGENAFRLIGRGQGLTLADSVDGEDQLPLFYYPGSRSCLLLREGTLLELETGLEEGYQICQVVVGKDVAGILAVHEKTGLLDRTESRLCLYRAADLTDN